LVIIGTRGGVDEVKTGKMGDVMGDLHYKGGVGMGKGS